MKAENTNKIDCLKCVHFAVTWNPRMPKSCKLYGFKSAGMPSAVVLKSTGSECMGFEKKEVFK